MQSLRSTCGLLPQIGLFLCTTLLASTVAPQRRSASADPLWRIRGTVVPSATAGVVAIDIGAATVWVKQGDDVMHALAREIALDVPHRDVLWVYRHVPSFDPADPLLRRMW